MSTYPISGPARRRFPTALLPIAALALLLLLAGCADRTEVALVALADGSWSGQARLSFDGAPPGVAAEIEAAAAALLDRHQIEHSLLETTPGSTQAYTLLLGGHDLGALGRLLADPAAAGAGLSGPTSLEIAGRVQAGETLEVALPANLSTGSGWAVEPAGGAPLALVAIDSRQLEPGDGALSRQVIRVRAGESGAAMLRLVYRRPWQPGAAPGQVITLNGADARLAALLAAVSLPEPPPARRAPPPAAPAAPQPAGATPHLPSAYNWCDHGGCTPVKDQGGCGSCWAFGAVGVLESAIKLKDGVTADLSEQYLLSCNHDGFGCDGGNWSAHDYHWNEYYAPETMAGAVPESEFTYGAWEKPCGGPYSHPYRVNWWSYVNPGDYFAIPAPAVLKQAIYDHGPVGVSVCVGDAFQDYDGGLFLTDEASDCGGGTNHAVMLVGWNDAEQSWILRNSWSPNWGESGYMRIRWGISSIGRKANYVDYTSLVPPDNWVYLPVVTRGFGSSAPPAGLPISEGFEGGLVPPAGWTRGQTNPRETWQLFTETPYSGSYAAHVLYDAGLAQQDEVLLSPSFTASSAQVQFYSFGSLYWCRDTYDNCDLNVWLVVGNWGDTDEIYIGQADSSWADTWVWSPRTMDLTPYLPAGTPVRVGFHYYGLDGAEVGLDQISITGSGLHFVTPSPAERRAGR